MVTVSCPYCAFEQNVIGFRPMEFGCLRCGASALWTPVEYMGEPRGGIVWMSSGVTCNMVKNMYFRPSLSVNSQLSISYTQIVFVQFTSAMRTISGYETWISSQLPKNIQQEVLLQVISNIVPILYNFIKSYQKIAVAIKDGKKRIDEVITQGIQLMIESIDEAFDSGGTFDLSEDDRDTQSKRWGFKMDERIRLSLPKKYKIYKRIITKVDKYFEIACSVINNLMSLYESLGV